MHLDEAASGVSMMNSVNDIARCVRDADLVAEIEDCLESGEGPLYEQVLALTRDPGFAKMIQTVAQVYDPFLDVD